MNERIGKLGQPSSETGGGFTTSVEWGKSMSTGCIAHSKPDCQTVISITSQTRGPTWCPGSRQRFLKPTSQVGRTPSRSEAGPWTRPSGWSPSSTPWPAWRTPEPAASTASETLWHSEDKTPGIYTGQPRPSRLPHHCSGRHSWNYWLPYTSN